MVTFVFIASVCIFWQSVLLTKIQNHSLETLMVMETSIYSSRMLRLLQLGW